ncbi:peptidase M15 [Gordonia jinghuaiqii]|uniref:M15 family metallopeptidase n=2 Tax=Gordonia jinghuaiqii TaxID=2758710 RepID=A0A7D7LP42_9ACTN|nr:M15 family metallopeptidase [Gordonia jinghuaiqii]MCR5976617.1 peptidase M15 [Gordonia jinghuaiqii]QMS99804.1 M15 family metallopeptidase [Gordonia jinghuaiqii]
MRFQLSSLCTALASAVVAAALMLGGPGATAAHAAPATAGLDPVLSAAYREASNTARAQNVPLWITSGKRTFGEQRQMWRDAIATYGSPETARRWVLPPTESPHVHGDAIDVGPREGAAWLEKAGYRWGLCRTFANEWWHFEVVTVPGLRCPPMWPDAATRADRRAG